MDSTLEVESIFGIRNEDMKPINLHQYVKEVLKCAQYRPGKDLNKVVAVVPVLPGCMTQGDNFEEARDNLIDAIELWINVGLREGEEMPAVNDCYLASAHEITEESISGEPSYV